VKSPADVHGTDAVKAPRRPGFTSDHQTGSHNIMRGSDGRIVVVPMHKPIKRGTLRGVLRQAGVSLNQFLGAL
jgi:predicted RNA binding protein YcfA (HicA-like mRNA interferase family)